MAKIANMNIEKIIKRKQHAKRNGNLRQVAEITKTLGDMYFENAQPKKALQEYTEQLSICENLQDKLNCAIAHRMIGEVHASLGDYEQALIHQNLHLEGAKDIGSLIEEQRAFATLGRTYFCLAESLSSQSQKRDEALANAKTAYVKSMELCDKLTEIEIKSEEKTLMQARLLLNLGLTLEAQKETQQAIDLIEQATALCISNDFQEDLHRTCISLAAIYERQDNHELALNYIETAATVNDVCLKAEAKLSKAELLMRIGQWIETRKILVSLYTSSGLPKDIDHQVEKYLRIVVTLCRAENSLLVETDIQTKQKLYETLGDAAVAVQCFDKSVEYYRHMLTCAEKTGNQISAALISLAQTLKDARRYGEALPFAQKEFELCSDPREKCRSALFLADLLVTTNAADTEVREYYLIALNSANESNNVRLQKLVTKELVSYLENAGEFEEAKNIRQKTGLLSETLSDTESEVSSCEESDKIGADICLEDLSDLETEENVNKTIITRKRRKRMTAVKRNEKGETQLHVACINGDINAVERLLSSNHPTNVRDHYGWSPLHEAANHGYVEIAELLLKHDANINNPGGPSCKGVTPLHDAASCGHFSMMQLLMQYGADITLKTHDGDTVLDFLEDWRDRVEDISSEDLVEYKIMYKKLSIIISTKKKRKNFNNVQISAQPAEPQKISAGEDYKRTIANLRSFNKTNSIAIHKDSNETITPLINEEQVLVDNWLEDDIERTVKKKSTSRNHITTSKRKSFNRYTGGTMKKRKQYNISQEKENFSTSEDSNDSIFTDIIQQFEEPKRTEKERQTSLLSNGFIMSNTPSSSTVHLQSSSNTSTNFNKEYVNVCVLIKEKVFNVKIDACKDKEEFLTSIITTLEQMFFNETGCKAKLFLQPINGDAITKEDILKVTRENTYKLECEIVKLQVLSIIERYKIICSNYDITPCVNILKYLKSCENTSIFSMKPNNTSEEMLIPLLKTLEYQKDIKILQLSGTTLLTVGTYLRHCLSNLSSLQELYLRGCDINFTCLHEINLLPLHLRVLDMSYNPLSSKSYEILRKLIVPLKYLQTLNLRYCELEDFCPPLENPNLISCDLSWNKLNRNTMISLLSKQLFDLSLSNTLHLSDQFTLNLDIMNTILSSTLESLELSFCNIRDSDVKVILEQLPKLSKLILSGNVNVTILSINMLLSRCPTLTYIDVSGCTDIVSDPEVGLVIQNPEICTLLANIEPNLCDSWIRLWRGTGIVMKLPHNLAIFKPI